MLYLTNLRALLRRSEVGLMWGIAAAVGFLMIQCLLVTSSAQGAVPDEDLSELSKSYAIQFDQNLTGSNSWSAVDTNEVPPRSPLALIPGAGDDVRVWTDPVDTNGLLDISSAAIWNTDSHVGLGVAFHAPFLGLGLGNEDSLWWLLDTDQEWTTGWNLGGSNVIGADYVVSVERSGESYEAVLVRTPSGTSSTWEMVGVFAAIHDYLDGGNDILVAEIPRRAVGNPDVFNANVSTIYETSYGTTEGDFCPDPPDIATYTLVGSSTTTTTTSPTTSTTEPPSTTTTTSPPVPSFTDVGLTHPYATAIDDLASRNIINGYTDGSFGPQKAVWRQHFAKMIVLSLDLPVSESDVCPFGDVTRGGPTTLYPDNFIAVAAQQGITKGIGGGKFGPYRDINRAQVITMVVRAVDKLRPGTLSTPPGSYSGTWGNFSRDHEANAKKAEYNGLLAALSISQRDPWGPMPRGEVAQVLYNLLGVME